MLNLAVSWPPIHRQPVPRSLSGAAQPMSVKAQGQMSAPGRGWPLRAPSAPARRLSRSRRSGRSAGAAPGIVGASRLPEPGNSDVQVRHSLAELRWAAHHGLLDCPHQDSALHQQVSRGPPASGRPCPKLPFSSPFLALAGLRQGPVCRLHDSDIVACRVGCMAVLAASSLLHAAITPMRTAAMINSLRWVLPCRCAERALSRRATCCRTSWALSQPARKMLGGRATTPT